MATILESLQSISGYPVPLSTIKDIAVKRGLESSGEAGAAIFNERNYQLAKADILWWVSFAPNVSQADVRYDLLFSDRERMREAANAIYVKFGDDAYITESTTKWGYKGNRL
jgi:hypothetical protein